MSESFIFRKCYCLECLTKAVSVPSRDPETRIIDYRYLEIAKELASKDAANESNYAVNLMFENKKSGEKFEEKCLDFEDCVNPMYRSTQDTYNYTYNNEYLRNDSYVKFNVSGIDAADRWRIIFDSIHNFRVSALVNKSCQITNYDGLSASSVNTRASSEESRKNAIKCIHNPPNESEIYFVSTILLSYSSCRMD
jgi:hypothetical protein